MPAITNGLPLTPLPGPLSVKLTLDAPGAGNWQGAMQDPSTGDWIIAEAYKLPDGSAEDCLFHRFTPKGVYIDSMTLNTQPGEFIHPTGFGVDNSSDIYVNKTHTGQVNSAMFKFPYVGQGKVVETANTTPVAPILPGNCQIALSPTRSYAVVRRVRATEDQFTKYAVADLLANNPVPLSPTLIVPRHDERVMQGFTIESDLLFCVTGYSNTVKVLEKYDLQLSKPLVNYDLTSIPGEPEGLDWNTIGFKQGSGTARKLALYHANL